MDGLKGLVWLSRTGRAESGGVLRGRAGLLGRRSCSRQTPGESTRVSPATPSRVRRAEGPGGGRARRKARVTPCPGYRKPWVFTDVDKTVFQDAREGSGALRRCPWRDRETCLLTVLLTHSHGPPRPRRGQEPRIEREATDGRTADGELPGEVVASGSSKSSSRSGRFALDSGGPGGPQGSRH